MNPPPFRLLRNRAAGFGLMELIVVVAIISVLASLILSGWKAARTTFLRTQCQHNLHQIHAGLMNYAMENSNRLPPSFGPPYTGQETAWSYYTWPYVYGSYANFKYPDNCVQMGTPVYPICTPNFFRCPATKEKMVKAPTSGPPLTARFSYGLNDTRFNIQHGPRFIESYRIDWLLACQEFQNISFPVPDNVETGRRGFG